LAGKKRHHGRKKTAIIGLDFEKAFDRVERDFIY
jgi:hypothetical protein